MVPRLRAPFRQDGGSVVLGMSEELVVAQLFSAGVLKFRIIRSLRLHGERAPPDLDGRHPFSGTERFSSGTDHWFCCSDFPECETELVCWRAFPKLNGRSSRDAWGRADHGRKPPMMEMALHYHFVILLAFLRRSGFNQNTLGNSSAAFFLNRGSSRVRDSRLTLS